MPRQSRSTLAGPGHEAGEKPRRQGVLIGRAAELVGVSVKAIRIYHARGVLAEPERDASGYRRYGPSELLALARIARLRRIGMSLSEIAPLVDRPDDHGAQLRERLRARDHALVAEISDLELRRELIAQLLAAGVDDPVAATPAEAWEDRAVAFLQAATGGLTAAQELAERRLCRALAAFAPAAEASDEEGLEAVFAAIERQWPSFADLYRRFHLLTDIAADDPVVDELADELQRWLATMFAEAEADWATARPDAEQAQDAAAAMAAALETLPPAQRRALELALRELLGDGS